MKAEIEPDCVSHNGTAYCYVANNTMQQCMPGTYEQGAKQLGKVTADQNLCILDLPLMTAVVVSVDWPPQLP